jgi:hypothetical protein
MESTGGRPLRFGWVCMLIFVVGLAVMPVAALGEASVGAVTPGEQGLGPIAACFWGRPGVNVGPIDELSYPVENELGPDTNVAYYYTRFQLPAGATVVLHGQFPHARFFSLTTYVVKGEVPGYPSTSIYDEQIDPDPGSINPFRHGEDRDARSRSYTVTISGQTPPVNPAPNTLYAGQEGATGDTQQIELMMRIYRPDKNLEANGGVPPPAPTLNLVGALPVVEEAAVCSALADVSGIENIITAHVGVPVSTYVHLRELAPAPHPATNPPTWERFFNNARVLVPFFRGAGEPYESLIEQLPTGIAGGLYSTPSNAYMNAYVDRTIGPNTEGHNILVLHAKMPTHPETYEHNLLNESAGVEVRYWSLCGYGSVAPLLPVRSSCLFDQEVPTNSNGEYTIVVSLPEDRPRNARPWCGVAWMDWGTTGDGHGRPTLDELVIRNQLSSPTFAQSIEAVTVPGTEREVMGAYYPTGTYETKQQFEGGRCWSANI